jgi:diguanylate cyclase
MACRARNRGFEGNVICGNSVWRWLLVLLGLVMLAADLSAELSVDLSTDQDQPETDLRAWLDRAHEVSYSQPWQNAQTMLDEVADRIDQAGRREYVDFHLLEARHLTLSDRSVEALERVAGLLDLDIDDDQRMRALQFSANAAVLLRDYEQAFEHLMNALALEVERVDGPPVIATYNMAAYMFGRVGEIERALEYGNLAVSRAIEINDPAEECISRQRLAPVYKWAELDAQAEAQYRQAIDLCGSIGRDLFVGVLQHGLADLLRRGDRLDEARGLALAAIDNLGNGIFPLGEFEARLVLAEILYDLRALEAIDVAMLADTVAYFGERELWDQLARLEALQASIAEANADPDTALIHLRRHLQARERFLNRDRAMRLAYLEVRFDTRLKEHQIELLRETARSAQLESLAIEQQRQFRTTSMALAGVMLVLLTLMLVYTLRGRRHFRHLSRHDSLTGLANHTWFFDRAETWLDEASHDNRLLYLVLADVDHFKAVNDQHGHQVGDEVLRQTAARLKAAFDADALIGRVGGEEFAILVRERNLALVLARLERIREEDSGAREKSSELWVTLSFGVSRARDGDHINTLRQRADQALYQAKEAGRNRYVVFDDRS